MRLLLDEMYAPDIAEGLRKRGHDVESASERPDLRAATDDVVFNLARAERRVIVTNNVRDFMPLAQRALQDAEDFYGIVFTSDRSLPRSRGNIGTYVEALSTLLERHAEAERLPAGVAWLP